MTSGSSHDLAQRPLHLGRGATAIPQDAMPQGDRAMDWYADYAARTDADGAEGRLVSSGNFTGNWTSWEMHPAGDEVVICTDGAMDIIQQLDGAERRIRLQAGQYAVNARGVWHTADVADEASAIFITPGQGTQHRPR